MGSSRVLDRACATCDGYEFVPDGTGRLKDCPDCRTRPRCPVHHRRVDEVGCCRECLAEADTGLLWLLNRGKAAVAA